MGKKLLVILLLAGIVSSLNPVHAEEASATEEPVVTATSDSTEPTATPLRKKATNETMLLNSTMSDARAAMKEKYKAARESFKEKLAIIKDEKKQTIASNLDEKFKTKNTQRTTQMSERLMKLKEIMTRLTSKETSLASEGKNTTALKTALSEAQVAIDAAQAAVDAQKEKEYIIVITTESALRTAATNTVKLFLSDIKAMRLKVLTAKTTIVKAYKEMGLLMGKNITPSVEPTAISTP